MIIICLLHMLQTDLDIVKLDGTHLRIISLSDQTHEMCYHAVKQNYEAISFIKDNFLKSLFVKHVDITLHQCINLCEKYYTSEIFLKRYVYLQDIIQTYNIIMFAVKQNIKAFSYVNPKFLVVNYNDELKYMSIDDIFIDYVEKCPSVMKYIVKPQTDETLVEVVTLNGLALEFIKTKSDKVCKAAINQNYKAVAFCEINEDLYLSAVDVNSLAIRYFKKDYVMTNMMCLYAMKKDPTVKRFMVIGGESGNEVRSEDLTFKQIYEKYREPVSLSIINNKYAQILSPTDSFEEFIIKVGNLLMSANSNWIEIIMEINKRGAEQFLLSKISTDQNCDISNIKSISYKVLKHFITVIKNLDVAKLLSNQDGLDNILYTKVVNLIYKSYPNILEHINYNKYKGKLVVSKASVVLIQRFTKPICNYIVHSKPKYIKYIPYSFQTEELCLYVVKLSIQNFNYCRKWQSVIKYVLTKNGSYLKYLEDKYINADTLMLALNSYPDAIKYLSKEFILNMLTSDGLLLRLFKEQTEDMCLVAVKSNYMALQYVSEQTKMVVEAAIDNNYMAVQFVVNKTNDVCLYAISKNSMALCYICN
jgi:hypothetical protein